MTDAEKQAASRVVAEVVFGWRWLYYSGDSFEHPEFTLMSPEEAHEHTSPGSGEYREPDGSAVADDSGVPDLFAPTPEGAWAREQARIWLIEHGWRLHVEHYAGEFGVQWTLTSDAFIERDGAAMIDAEARAIYAAVVALGAGKVES